MPVVWTFTAPAVDPLIRMLAGARAAELAGANALLSASQPFVPVDTGELKESGKVTADATGAIVSYERTSPEGFDVATHVHEDLTANHPGGGQAKFLESPMHSAHGEILGAEAAAFGAAL